MSRIRHILITSISAKVPLIKAVNDSREKYDSNIKIYGADVNDNIIGKYFVDHFWLMPRISDLSIEKLISYCVRNGIKYIIPTRDADVVYFSTNKEELFRNGIYCFVSNYKSVEFCFDKLLFYQSSNDNMVIPTFTNFENMKEVSSFVVKERFGAGSNGIAVNVSYEEAKEFADKLESPIIQPFINGEEFSIDSYLDKDAKCLGSIVRSRDLVVGGESKITTRIIDKDLEKKVKSFLENNRILGHSILQVIKKENKYHIIECNARFGGASTLSYTLGLESFLWFFKECNQEDISPKISNKKIRQVRVSKDMYFES